MRLFKTTGTECAIILSIILVTWMTPLSAEPVLVNQGSGLGYVFNHKGNCFVILPEHVHGTRHVVTLRTSEPSTYGDARIFKSFVPGADLSIGLVSSSLGGRCADTWEQLPARTDSLLDGTDDAVLVRIEAAGGEEVIPMKIVGRDYETLSATLANAGDKRKIYKGTSGGILKIGNVVVGMAFQAFSEKEAKFLRIDAIKSQLDRLIEARIDGEAYAADNSDQVSNKRNICAVPKHLVVRSVTCNTEPISPDNACSNLVGRNGATPVVLPLNGPIELIAELDTEKAVAVNSIALKTKEGDTTTSVPKSVKVEVDSSSGSAPRWRYFGASDMTPFGDLKVTNGTAPFVRRIKISIDNAWDPDKAIRIDCLAVSPTTANQ